LNERYGILLICEVVVLRVWRFLKACVTSFVFSKKIVNIKKQKIVKLFLQLV